MIDNEITLADVNALQYRMSFVLFYGAFLIIWFSYDM